MIGLLTSISDATSPFHKDNIPSLITSYFPAYTIETFLCACLVFNTQNGFVAMVATHPADPDDFIMLNNEFGLKLNNFLA